MTDQSATQSYKRINNIIINHGFCGGNAVATKDVSVGTELKKKQQKELGLSEAQPLNNIELHEEQSNVTLSNIILEDSVLHLQNKDEISIDDWLNKVGSTIGKSKYLEITQDRIDAFAVTTGDPQWIHTRAAKSLGSPFGAPVAHGFLTLSLLPYLTSQCIPSIRNSRLGVNYGLNKLRFIQPVKINQSVRAVVQLKNANKIDAKGSQNEGIENIYTIIVEIKDSDKPALSAEWITRSYF